MEQSPGKRLHDWVLNYNWDDGLAPILVIADSPQTEFATALLIYWRLGGPWLEAGSGRSGEEAKRLQDLVRDRLLAGFYPLGSSRFDPSADLTRVQLYQLRKRGIPELLLGSAGAAPSEPGAPPK